MRYLLRSMTASKPYTPLQSYIQQIFAVSTASVSILLGIITFYWFLRIKRNFRHQYERHDKADLLPSASISALTHQPLHWLMSYSLIALLVAANTVKAIGYLIYPLAELVQHTTDLSRALCIANGFHLLWGSAAAGMSSYNCSERLARTISD